MVRLRQTEEGSLSKKLGDGHRSRSVAQFVHIVYVRTTHAFLFILSFFSCIVCIYFVGKVYVGGLIANVYRILSLYTYTFNS